MPGKHKKNKVPRLPKTNLQIPISRIRPIQILGPRWADEKKLRQALKIDPVFVPII